jgi:hypothetical protein
VRFRWPALGLFLTAPAVLATGCSSPPEIDQLRGSIVAAAAADPAIQLSDDQITCVAQRLLDSGLSDTTLNGLAADFNSPEVLSSESASVQTIVAEATAACVVDG